MLRIGITSDVHIDMTPVNRALVPHLVEAAAESALDALIICGDVSPSLLHLARFLGAFSSLDCPKFFVAGNHDIWVLTPQQVSSEDKYRALDAVCRECGFHHLPAGPQVVQGLGLCGTIGWYDFSFRCESLNIPLERYEQQRWGRIRWRDRQYARWSGSDAEVADRCAEALRHQLASFPPSVRTVLVATHYVPFRECVPYRGKLPHDFFMAFMGSEKLGAVCASNPRVRYVVYGHAHHPQRRSLGPITALCSPIGYLFEEPSQGLRAYARERLTVLECL